MVSQTEALHGALVNLDLRPEHDLLVAYCRGLAEQLDEHPDRATLWREYRPAVELLTSLGAADVDDGQATLLELVRTPVRDSAAPGA